MCQRDAFCSTSLQSKSLLVCCEQDTVPIFATFARINCGLARASTMLSDAGTTVWLVGSHVSTKSTRTTVRMKALQLQLHHCAHLVSRSARQRTLFALCQPSQALGKRYQHATHASVINMVSKDMFDVQIHFKSRSILSCCVQETVEVSAASAIICHHLPSSSASFNCRDYVWELSSSKFATSSLVPCFRRLLLVASLELPTAPPQVPADLDGTHDEVVGLACHMLRISVRNA